MTENEKMVKRWLEGTGWTVFHRGWPDFLCVKPLSTGGVGLITIEAKNYKDKLSPEQESVHQILKRFGVPVYVIRPQNMKNSSSKLHSRTFLSQRDLEFLKNSIGTLEEKIIDIKKIIDEGSVLTEAVLRDITKTPIFDKQDQEIMELEK